VYAAVVFGGAASGIYRSDDAGKTWEKTSTTSLPEVLTLTIAPDADADVKFIAGTEKGFFWSADAREWKQAEPSGFPIRVAKVLRFNRTRAFAATAEGVFTTRDGGKTWYRLAGAGVRAVDIAIGNLGERKSLFALTTNGLDVFDGEKWTTIADAPVKGRTVAMRGDRIYIAGAQGVKAGNIDASVKWQAIEAPDAQYAAVYGSQHGVLFLASRQQREILVGDARADEWLELTLPSRNTEVTSIAPDPFAADRYYVGTLGEGIFVWEGRIKRYEPRGETRAQLGTSGGGQ
jgi:photosystem II stability/assembly factor-like uncharacterized protein